jgi:hypothetical protein
MKILLGILGVLAAFIARPAAVNIGATGGAGAITGLFGGKK